ncbi:uncharacterized protein LOC127528764 isoform X2 [Erpetoichthys calabaricus]|uniref:uncharacterized protein LOC127528764 isoform X2 n=1 Tax=Erpetoichthys calabaricus TaxID=27687 RepID=UPI0022349405|nr:uncharacterized protein LOC127528764 isoform X2 [Erpetoichthys calabaricus]
MSKTFALRRHEVVELCPTVAEFKDRWPALFDILQINEEFRRITTLHLEPTFIKMLDYYTPKLFTIFSCKGGALGQILKKKMGAIQQYENEDVQQSLLQQVMKIAVCKKDDQEDFSIVLEGVQVMTGLGNLTRVCAILLGFTHALNLTYPKQLRNMFEAFQKLFLELDVCRFSPKLQSLKNKLVY